MPFDPMSVVLVQISMKDIYILYKYKSGENITIDLKSAHYPDSTIINIFPALF